MKKLDYTELDDEQIEAIKVLIDDFEKEDRSVRERQIRTWKRYDFMWNGFHQIWWDSVAHDWRIYGYGDVGYGDGDNQAEYYDKNVNVFRAFIETLVAALSNTVPPIKCVPDDADNINDVLTAKGGSKIGELVYGHIDAPLLWVRALWVYHLQGLVAAYNYTDEDEKYGTVDLPKEEDETQQITESACPQCDKVIDKVESGVIADTEKDEYDPGDDDVELHDDLNEGQLFCPECQAMIDPEIKKRNVIVTRLTGMIHQPKARQCIDVQGGLYVKVPNWARTQADCPYLSYNFETHYSNIYEKYPDLQGKLAYGDLSTGVSSPDGNQLYERWGRLNPQYRGEYPLNTPTERHWWLRHSAFNCINEDDLRESLKEKFPDGCYAIMVNDQWVGACNQNLDDHWTLSINPMSNSITYEPPASLLTAIQEITSTLISLELQCIEHSVPITIANPRFLNLEQYRNTEIVPGAIINGKLVAENRNISDGFHTLQTATVPPELDAFGAKVNELGQFTSGALPQVWGGSSGGSTRTASQYAMQRNGSQQRLSNLTGRTFNAFWKNIFAKVIPAYIKDMVDDERLVKEVGNENFVNILIKKSELTGKIGNIRVEAPEGLPQTIEQVRETVMNLLTSGNQEILAAIGSPENLPVISKIIGLNDFHVPGESDREKQYEEIGILIQSGPMPMPPSPENPQGGEMPSVMPELVVDNHQIESLICRDWLVSEKGRQCKIENPEGYKNVLLHLQQHILMMQQGMQQNPQPQPAAPQPQLSRPKGN